jgi:hypothetical protein
MNYLMLGYSGFAPYRKWLTSIFISPFVIYYLTRRGQYTLLDNADLIIHEAGHFFFSFFGNFIHAAGGTLMQIFLPSFIGFYFFRAGFRTGVQVFIFWLGQNLVNISVYASDANVRQLKLLGNGKHDWYYMLDQLGVLEHAEGIGFIFFASGFTVFFTAILLPLFVDD